LHRHATAPAFFAALDEGGEVSMVPATLPDGSTLCLPNTVAILRGCDDLPAAQRLVDYLTSAASELALARSRSRQIPLGPVDEAALPEEVRALLPAARRSYGFADLAGASRDCLAWLREMYRP
jgi:iron(III) transport system substrate-binding protein